MTTQNIIPRLLGALKGVTLTQEQIDMGTTASDEQHAVARQVIADAEATRRWPQVDMGFGKFAVGSCTCAVTGVPGLLYLHLDEPRPHNADCSDVFPVGSTAPENRIASIIHFHSAQALQQTIDELLSIQREHYPAAEQAQQVEPCRHCGGNGYIRRSESKPICCPACSSGGRKRAAAQQQAEPVAADPAVAAIQFALETHSDGLHFLRLWNEGEFDLLRREWPEAPEDIYIGADPLLETTDQPPAVAVPGVLRGVTNISMETVGGNHRVVLQVGTVGEMYDLSKAIRAMLAAAQKGGA